MTNRTKAFAYKILSFLVYLIPMVVLLISRWEHYAGSGSSFGFFFYIAMAFCVIAFKEIVLDFIKKKVLLSVSAILFTFSIVMMIFAEEMVYITGVSTLGALMQGFVGCVSDVYTAHSTKIVDGVARPNLERAIPDKQAWREAYGIFAVAEEKDE